MIICDDNNNNNSNNNNALKNNKRRLCGNRDEMVDHIISECSKLIQKK